MGWNVSKILQSLSDSFLHGQLWLMEYIELDPEKWDDLKKGLNYDEAPVEQAQQGQAPVAPVGIGIWFEMLKIFLLIALAGVLIYLIVRLLSGKKLKRNKQKKKDTKRPQMPEAPTALSPLEELWQHLREAQEAENYRECLRTLYQIALKKLGDNGWVKTKIDKTNYEYLNELSGKLPAADFAILTAIFEYNWYGDVKVKPADFGRYEPQFMDFIKRDDLEKQS